MALTKSFQGFLEMRSLRRLLFAAAILIYAVIPVRGSTFLSLQCVPECHYTPFGIWSGSPVLGAPSKAIRMDSQDVTMRLKKSSYSIDAVFHFFNTGETSTEWLGFPKQGNACRGNRLLAPSFIRFDCWIDGQKTQLREDRELVRDMKNTLYTLYYSGTHSAPCHETYYRWLGQYLTFPARSRTMVRISYEADYVSGGEMPPLARAIYTLGAASHWKGSNGDFVFSIDGSSVGRKHFHVRRIPKATLVAEDLVQCRVKGLTPLPDDRVEVAIERYR